MAFKYSKGERKFGDIKAEGDAQGDTLIDFEEDQIDFQTSGSVRLRIENDTITTTIPVHISGSEIEGLRIAKGGSDYRAIVFETDGVDTANISVSNAENLVIQNETNGKDIQFWVNPSSDSNTQAMTIKEDVKIGINNTSPSTTLDVGGDTTITGSLSVSEVATYNTVEYFNSNTMKFNQYYLGNATGSYFSANEYQKVITIIPSGDSQNYQVIGRITAQNAGETHTVYFNAALRSNTLPDLDWTINYDEEYNGGRYIDPQLWTKETTTAGFIFAFKTLATIYGNVTVDIDVVPRNSSQKANVTINNNESSEQTSIDAGYTANDMTKVISKKGQEITFANTFTFPTTDGNSNQVLTTDGSGNLTFQAQATGSGANPPGGSDRQVQFNDNGSLRATMEFLLIRIST